MGSERITIPEDNLQDVVCIIRAGIKSLKYKIYEGDISRETVSQLNKWCDEIEDHYWGAPEQED